MHLNQPDAGIPLSVQQLMCAPSLPGPRQQVPHIRSRPPFSAQMKRRPGCGKSHQHAAVHEKRSAVDKRELKILNAVTFQA
jgi:hypothetical protein